MSWRSFDEIRRRERELQRQLYNILYDIIVKKRYSFHGIVFKDVVWEWKIDGRSADIVILDDRDNPFLIIETKRKIEKPGYYKAVASFHVTDRAVVGQAISYAALAKKQGLTPEFIATCNPTQIAIFKVPENIEELVNWDAIRKREYEKVLPLDLYREMVYGRYRVDTRDLEFNERFFVALIEDLVAIAKKVRKVEDVAPITYKVIRDLRGFVYWLAYNIEPMIKKELQDEKSVLRRELERISREKGYSPTPEQLAKEMAYVFMNKIVFYKVLERYWGKLPKLTPLLTRGVKSANEYINELNKYFEKAIEVTQDFEPIFITGIYDLIQLPDDPLVLQGIDEFISYIEGLSIEKLSDIIGYVYEELIPADERRELGQFYTPPSIAELIVKWCVRSPDDTVLDPGCGSGTFLIQAYKQLHYLKTGKKLEEVRYPKREIHEKILEQLYAIDINEFPAHLTAMNLAMRNPRAPSTKMNVVVADFFSIEPCQSVVVPYKTVIYGVHNKGEVKKGLHVPKVDCVVGNPPYTRWRDIPDKTKKLILERIGEIINSYDLLAAAGIREKIGIYIPFIIHAYKFLKDHGRLGMIISDSWLQTEYGINFGRYLLDHFKIKAIIDFAQRLFRIPTIATLVILLEKEPDEEARKNNDVVFIYVDKEISVDELLEAIENPGKYRDKLFIKVIKQGKLPRDKKWFEVLFGVDDLLKMLSSNPYVVKLRQYFEPMYGTIYWTAKVQPGLGANKFFYIDEETVRRYGLHNYVVPAIENSRLSKYYTFTKKDWEEIKRKGKRCYLFLCHEPFDKLPDNVKKYIEEGERQGFHRRTLCEVRAKKKGFYGWYDLGGIVEAAFFAPRTARYGHRFTLIEPGFKIALDEDFIAFRPLVKLSIDELKALLAYLNSSFTQLYIESRGKVPGGVGPARFEVGDANEMPILDIKRLPREIIEKLSQLFDKLEAEARKLGSADTAENVYGSELAKEIIGKEVRKSSMGLFNTVIKEIDYEIARILGLENIVEHVRAMVIEFAKRRLARSAKAKPESLKGSEKYLVLEEEKTVKGKRRKQGRSDASTTTLDKWLKPGGAQ